MIVQVVQLSGPVLSAATKLMPALLLGVGQ
jgi:hypothetical protein